MRRHVLFVSSLEGEVGYAPGGGMMRVLISNDDGYGSEGIRALTDVVMARNQVWVVAPQTEQSAQSHALTLHKPLRAKSHGPTLYSVSGTPADCVYLALHQLMDEPPDLMVSGINRGGNLGHDVFYSGTVAAAREACLAGVPSVAFSLHLSDEDQLCHWDTARAVATQVLSRLTPEMLPKNLLLNVNVPNVPLKKLKGLKMATLGERTYHDVVLQRSDPRGKEYYWLGGAARKASAPEGTDIRLVKSGYATLTPLSHDLTSKPAMKALKVLCEPN